MNRFVIVTAIVSMWLSCTRIASAQDYQVIQHSESNTVPHNDEDSGDAEARLDLDFFRRFSERETNEGYPILEAIKTDHAFLMRKIGLDLLASRGADGGRANDSQFTGEFSWAVNNRFALEFDSPFIFRSQIDAATSRGLGDTELGARLVACDGAASILTFGLNVSLPTGSRASGLGEGYTSLEPVALFWHDFGGGNVLQSEMTLRTPIGAAEGGTVCHYNLALGHTIRATEHLPFFSWLTPSLELNGLTNLNGNASGRTEINLTSGVRWLINDKNDAALGFSFPITAARDYDSQIVLDWCHDF